MKSIITALLASTLLSACVPMVAAPVLIAAAVPVDRAINTAIGGTPGKTISGDTARARIEGKAGAEALCGVYTVVAPFDLIWFNAEQLQYMADKGAKDHCDRWAMYEAGEVKHLEKPRTTNNQE